MSSDRELLELAAKAAGYRVGRDPSGAPNKGRWDLYWDVRENALVWHGRQGGHEWPEAVTWSPLDDNGDALRLAVQLRIWLDYSGCSDVTPSHICAKYLGIKGRASSTKWVHVEYVPEEMFTSAYLPDRTHAVYQLEQGLVRGLESATRRAIVRAAAEIGKTTP